MPQLPPYREKREKIGSKTDTLSKESHGSYLNYSMWYMDIKDLFF
ncbi:MAG TPA: hypothetical protein VIP56_04890 [Nitrososphaeraceae archaeon]